MADLTYESKHTGKQVDDAVDAVIAVNYKIQEQLVSGVTIKTVNGGSVLGNGNIDVVAANPAITEITPTLDSIMIKDKEKGDVVYKIGENTTLSQEIKNIKNGTTIVGKADSDANGNPIDETYATKTELGTLSQKVTTVEGAVTAANTAATEAKNIANNAMPKAGGSFTGAVTILTPSSDMNPATKKYVDDVFSGATVAIDNFSIVKNSEGKLQMRQEFIDYLNKQLFKAPQITLFTVLSNSGGVIPTTNELGTSLTATSIRHQESNISNIKNQLTLSGGGVTKQIDASETSIVVTLDNSLIINDNTVFTLNGADIMQGSFSSSYRINFYRYAYTAVTGSIETPTSGTKQSATSSFASNGAGFDYSQGDYIYFYTTGAGKKVQTYVLGQWADVETTELGTVEFTQNNSAKFNYNVYRIGPFIASGSAKYRV